VGLLSSSILAAFRFRNISIFVVYCTGLHNRLKGTIISRQLRLLGSPDGRDSSILIH